jgi:hypothetical protein
MNAVPPKIHAAGSRAPGIILAATGFGIAAVIFFLNPATHHFYPVCQFHRLTGLNCPGCGMTRAFYALLHGEFLTALQDNALLVLALITLVIRVGWRAFKKIRGHATGEFFPVKFLWPLLTIAIMFTVLRNLPAFAFLSP